MSEIGIKDYLRLLDKLVLVQEQRGFPAQLETGSIQPVFDISNFLSAANVRTVGWAMTALPLGGSSELEIPVISTGEDGSYNLVDKNARIFGLGCSVFFTVAGAAAAAGNRISSGWSVIVRDAGYIKNPFSENQLENGKLVVAAILEYRFYFGASHNTSVYNALMNNLLIGPTIVSPNVSPGFGLSNTITMTTGAGVLTPFPAGTTMSIWAAFYETDKPLIPPL
jgi:hypothetical protein